MKNVWVRLVVVVFAVASLFGCKSESVKLTNAPEAAKASYLDESRTDLSSLGWLGATSHPVSEAFSLSHPEKEDKTVSPGGLVLVEVFADTPAATAGLKKGDVIAGVGQRWLPINDDPTMDFVREIETEISTGNPTMELWVMRDGSCEKISLEISVKPLDEGLPYNVTRFKNAAALGEAYLAGLQNEDGSFGSETLEKGARIQVTSLAGLALLASDNDFDTNIEKCQEFIAETIDEFAKSEEEESSNDSELKETDAADSDEKKAIGMQMVKMPKYEIDAATASYALMFLSEADVQMLGGKWMPRIMDLLGSLSQTQDETGAWGRITANESEAESEEDAKSFDLVAAHTTNHVLLALGMMERKGISGNPEVIAKACEFLKSEFVARESASIDRRVKAGLAASAAAALRSINCQTRDPFLLEATKTATSKIEERISAPAYGLASTLATAVFARQSNKENWQQFHDGCKYMLSSFQKPDGSFAEAIMPDASPESQNADAAWRTAHCCLLLSMQQGKLKKLIAETKSPMMVTRDSDGKKVEGVQTAASDQAMPGGLPSGAQAIQLDMDGLDPSDPDFQDKLKEKLKEMGIDTGNIKMGTAPPSGDK